MKRRSVQELERQALSVLAQGKATLADDKKKALAKLAAQEAYDSAASITKLAASGLAQRFLNAARRAVAAGHLDISNIDPKSLEKATGFVLTAAQSQSMMRDVLLETYTIGKFNAIKERESVEFIMLLTKRDKRVRPHHAAVHGLIMPKNDPRWPQYLPPNGHGCRCWIKPLTAKQANYLLSIQKQPVTAPPGPVGVTVDRGFDLTPEQRVNKLARKVEEALTSL